ncbi:MAG: hypothetical protein ACLS5G_07345 [Streptococcus sp.]
MDTIMIKTLVLSSLIALFMSTTGITEISMVIVSSATITIPGNDIVGQDGQSKRNKDLDREDFYYYVDAKGIN